jgi:pimeloyl-ACP methyl ester carboxylesterase
MKQINSFILSAILLLSASCGGKQTGTTATTKPDGNAIVLRLQGSFAIGGTVITQPGTYNTQQPFKADGQTLHGDHAYVSYQIPDSARRFLMVFLHGAGQSAKTWESTPDGREGFSTIFLRRHFGTYLIDQPRRGRAGRSTVSEQVNAVPDDQFWFENFRMGVWPNLHKGSQFPAGEAALNQFFRQITPNTGAFDEQVIAASLAALCDTLGGSILITHSQGGGPGWHTAIRSRNVKAIVSYEPGSGFVFPESETPEPLETISPFGALSATPIPMDDFMKLTRIPIIIYYGDYIPDEPSDNWAMDSWRVRLKMAQLFAECINRHGGDAMVVHLPEQGIKGNSHFLFAEKNNVQLADLLSDWLKEKGLD